MKHTCRSLFFLLLSFLFLVSCTPSSGEEAYQAGFSEGYAQGFAEGQRTLSPAPTGSHPPVPTAEASPPSAAPEPSVLPGSPMDSSGFVLISDAVPEVLLEIRYYSTYNFVGERIDGYEEPVALLTQEAAQALAEASEDFLRQGYRLKIYDAYRPQCAVDHFVTWAQDLEDIKMKPYFYPQVEKSKLFQQGYIASRSGHSRGSTVDVTLVEMSTGKEVDMGGVFDKFDPSSHTDYRETLTEAQVANRELLQTTMWAHGFRGISTEWWHFTLKEEPYPDTYFQFPVSSLSSSAFLPKESGR